MCQCPREALTPGQQPCRRTPKSLWGGSQEETVHGVSRAPQMTTTSGAITASTSCALDRPTSIFAAGWATSILSKIVAPSFVTEPPSALWIILSIPRGPKTFAQHPQWTWLQGCLTCGRPASMLVSVFFFFLDGRRCERERERERERGRCVRTSLEVNIRQKQRR